MEAQLCRQDPPSRALLRCSAEDVILRELPTDAESAPRSRAAAALCLVYGRAAAGVLRPEQARPARDLAERALGSDDARRLRELLDQVAWVGDADHEQMAELARRFREVVGEDPPEEGAAGERRAGDGAGGDRGESGSGEDQGDGPGRSARGDGPGLSAAELDEELERVREAVRGAAREASDRGAGEPEAHTAADELEQQLKRALASEEAPRGPGGLLAGLPRGSLPSAGKRRAPSPPERRAAERLAAELRRIKVHATALEGRVVPPGRFSGRGAVRQASERARGAPLRGEAFRARVTKPSELFAPHVAVAIDTSGSMSSVAPALSSVLYVLARDPLDRRAAVRGRLRRRLRADPGGRRAGARRPGHSVPGRDGVPRRGAVPVRGRGRPALGATPAARLRGLRRRVGRFGGGDPPPARAA